MSSAPPGTTKRDQNKARVQAAPVVVKTPKPERLEIPSVKKGMSDKAIKASADQRAKETARKSALEYKKEQDLAAQRSQKLGGLASNSIFADDMNAIQTAEVEEEDKVKEVKEDLIGESKHRPSDLTQRSISNMEIRLNPNPQARSRWLRRKVIKQVRRRGRLTREELIARTERTHTSRSAFFATSIKKLNPIARQIAGKSIDAAIMQLRFSRKKNARSVLKHLLQARNEAVVIKGMGLNTNVANDVVKQKKFNTVSTRERIESALDGGLVGGRPYPDVKTSLTQSNAAIERVNAMIADPSTTVPLPTQTPGKELKKGIKAAETDMYIAEAWVNRGAFQKSPEFRARGRQHWLRHPHTGISLVLKEEKTRTREREEKSLKKI